MWAPQRTPNVQIRLQPPNKDTEWYRVRSPEPAGSFPSSPGPPASGRRVLAAAPLRLPSLVDPLSSFRQTHGPLFSSSSSNPALDAGLQRPGPWSVGSCSPALSLRRRPASEKRGG